MQESPSSQPGPPGGPPGAGSGAAPVVTISGGAVRGMAVSEGYVFRGLPFAAPPVGDLRWRPPRPAEGLVVVTVNHRLGALGFLAHPALASRPGGPSGNYGLMDQQAALRWVRDNIRRFGGDPGNVTIAGQSSGGLSVLVHMISRGSRDLFQNAIVQSGSFALTQQSLAAAEADSEAFAARAGCPGQSADGLRRLPVADVVSNFPSAAIPGVVDGEVLEEPVGTALAAGRFARVPILNGINHDEQRVFVTGAEAVSGGAFVPVPEPVTVASYERVITSVLGISAERAAAIVAEYPVNAEFPYLFDLPDAPLQGPLSPPRPQVETDFAARHHCAFWAAG